MTYEKGTCEFCGKKTEHLESTSFVGLYCIGCHKILIEQSLDAIRKIQANKKHTARAKIG